jgi:DNA-binding GntR family transcriptional regulator
MDLVGLSKGLLLPAAGCYAKLGFMYTESDSSSTKSGAAARVATGIVARLEREILQGTLPPGARLDEQLLAERFGVSRTPVREALLELAAQGLATQQAHRGTFVADVTLEDVFGSYEVLAELEGLCARLATRRMTAVQKHDLQQLHERMGRSLGADLRSQYIEMDAAFHATLVAGAHNPALAEHIRLCVKKISPVRLTSMYSVTDMAAAHAEHEALLQAILSGDDLQAERLMIGHVALRSDSVRDLVAVWNARRADPAQTSPTTTQNATPQQATNRRRAASTP